jgi:PAS domain S-box-containing protein
VVNRPPPRSMSDLTLGSIGTIGILLGFAFVLLAFLLTRILPRAKSSPPNFSRLHLDPSPLNPPSGGVLLVKSGGRVDYINQQARAWFGFSEEKPHLERLVGRTQPDNVLLSLCASEGQARFSINGIYVEASSVCIPYDGSKGILVSMHRPDIHALISHDPENIEHALNTFSTLSQSMAADLDLETTLQAIIEGVVQLIPCDFPEITIWDPDNHILIPYQLAHPGTSEHKLEKTTQRYVPGQGYSGYLLSERKPLLVSNVDNYTTVRPAVDRDHFYFQSYLGVPLMTAGELVGTLELASLKEGAFTPANLEILQILSGHAAVALHNAVLYQRQRSRVLELSGLAQLAHAVGTFRAPKDLYASLLESIKPLLHVEMIGFWIYDENQHSLQAQAPFIGIPSEFIDLYRVDIEPESDGEKILLSQEVILANDAALVPTLAVLKLDAHAQAAGMQDTVLTPLSSGGKMMGYLQVADKQDRTPFDQDDLRLLSIIAAQAAITIENATLVQLSQSRAQRAEALRKIGSLTQSVATLDEILQFSLRELAHLLKADIAAIFLLDESSGEARLHKPSLFGSSAEILGSLGQVSIDRSQSVRSEEITRTRSFISGNAGQDTLVPSNLQPLISVCEIQSIISVPLMMRDRSMGQIILGSRAENYFDRNDMILIDTSAGQLAGALEQSTLLAQTDESLRRRVDQLTALTRISRELNSTLELDQLLRRVYEELLLTTQADCGSIILFNPGTQVGHNPAISFQIGDQHTEELTGLEQKVFQEQRAIVVNETDQNAIYQPGLILPHKAVRSALIVPITNQGEMTGLIHLHARQPNRFDQTALDITESLASQTAIAIWNIQRYQEQAKRSDASPQAVDSPNLLQKNLHQPLELQQMNEQMQRIQAALEIAEVIASKTQPDDVLTSLGQEMVARLNMDIALAVELTRNGPHLVGMFGTIPEAANPEALLGQRNPLRHCLNFGKNILVANLENNPEWRHSLLLQTLDAQAFICLAIPGHRDRQDQEFEEDGTTPPTGAVIGISRTPLAPFIPDDEQLFSFLARQVAAAIESLQLLSETKRRLHEVNSLLEFSQQLGSLEPITILHTLVASALKVVPAAHTCMVAIWDAEKGCLVTQFASGYVENDSILNICYRPGEGLPALAYDNGQPIRLDSVDFPQHYNLQPENLLRYRDATEGRVPVSCLVVPVGGNPTQQQDARGKISPRLLNPMGVLVLENFEAQGAFRLEDQQLVSSLAHQTALTLENARLFAQTQRLYSETAQRSSELAGLFEVGYRLSQMLDEKQLIETIFEKLAELLNIRTATVIIKDESGVLKAQHMQDDIKHGPHPYDEQYESWVEQILNQGEALLVNDLQTEFKALQEANFVSDEISGAWLGVPLIGRGVTLGVLTIQSETPRYFGEPQTRFVTQIANQLAIALDNARLFSTVQRYASDLEKRVEKRTTQLGREYARNEALLSIMSQLSTSLDMDLVLNRTLGLINEKIGAQHSLIMLLQPDKSSLFLRAALGSTHTTPEGGQPTALKANEGLVGWVITHRKPALISDLTTDARWLKLNDQPPPNRSAIAVPLMISDEILGALLLYHQEAGVFDEDQLDLAQATAKQIAVAINNSQLYHLIRDQAERLGDMLHSQHVESSRLEAILEAVADGVLVTDAKRVVTLFNHSAEKILDLSRQQVLGQSLEHFRGLFGKAAHTWVETIQAWSTKPTPYPAGDIYSERIDLEDGRVISVHLSPVYLKSDFLGTVSIFRDISHQVEVDRLKSEFVATVSHELRTPMTSIKGYVEILLMGAAGSLDAKQAHYLEIVKANTERLAILVNDLLDISRIETGRIILSPQPLDLYDLITKALEEIKRRASSEGKSVQIEANLPAGVPCVLADRERVFQILGNLLENAYLYTPENGCIRVSLQTRMNEVQIDIQDNGIGISPQDQPHIFERFYRGEDPLVLAASGTGLGLSIVQRLVDMHHGKMWFRSSGIRGEGTTFSFTLPVYREESL